MHFKRHTLLCLLGLACLGRLLADYPLASHRYLADPTPLVHDGEVYIYCSNDDLNQVEGGYNIPNVVCISSRDMKNWTDHGVVFDARRDTRWAQKTWAPAAIQRDGSFFLYFGNGGGSIGVVKSQKPSGPFADVLKEPLITTNTPGVMPAENMWLFDPAVFIDDDSQAYLYFGGNGEDNARVIKLDRNMISVDGPAQRFHVPFFFEASWMHKRNGIYYFSYSTTPKTGMRIDYMKSKSPTGGFDYAGVLAAQPPENNNNNHAAEFEFRGDWYHVYHNRIVAKNEGIPTGFRRNLAIEKLSYNEDHSIQTIDYTTDSVAQRCWIDAYSRVEAETFSGQRGIETEPCSNGGMNLSEIHHNDWIRVSGVDFRVKGAARFKAEIACASQGGSIEIHKGSLDGPLLGVCAVSNTEGPQSWKTSSCEVQRITGVHDIYLKFVGGEGTLFNVNYWTME